MRLAMWFDCEDYVSPYEPVCLWRLTEIFARRGLRATWKLVGEEARMLGRAAAGTGADAAAARAAIASIAAQGLGFHTDWHSRHPTVAEYCSGAGWEEGMRRFERVEGPGLASLRRVFPGTGIACYGQPGAAWAPQAVPVLRRWGIPLYMDEAGHVGLDEQPFFYCGVLHVLRLRGFCVRRRGHRPPAEGPADALRDLDGIVAALRARGGGLAQCWWHPNECYTDEWWDQINFGAGVNRAGPPYRVPAPLPEAEREARFASLEAFVDAVARRGDLRVCPAEEIVAAYPDPARGRTFCAGELRRVAEAILDGGPSYQRHAGFTLSAGEALFLLASALASSRPEEGAVLDVSPDGPARRVAAEPPPSADAGEVRAAAAVLVAAVRLTGRLPDSVPLGRGSADPASLALACAGAVARAAGGPVPVPPARLRAEEAVRGAGVWDWPIFRPGFDPVDLIELGRLQAWTLKPALPAG